MKHALPDGPLPGEPVLLKENPARCLMDDARRALDAARKARSDGDDEAEASSSRGAILLYFAALEGFINFVYAWSGAENESYQAWSTERKWRRSVEECLPRHGTIHDEDNRILYRPGDPIEPFDADSELLARFIELRDARNDMVHAQPVFTLLAPERIDEHMAVCQRYPRTRLPKSLTHFRLDDAETVAALFDAMVDRLDVCLRGDIRRLLSANALYEYRIADDPERDVDDEELDPS